MHRCAGCGGPGEGSVPCLTSTALPLLCQGNTQGLPLLQRQAPQLLRVQQVSHQHQVRNVEGHKEQLLTPSLYQPICNWVGDSSQTVKEVRTCGSSTSITRGAWDGGPATVMRTTRLSACRTVRTYLDQHMNASATPCWHWRLTHWVGNSMKVPLHCLCRLKVARQRG